MDRFLSHRVAEAIFYEIRERPYAWALRSGDEANNCYTKGIELLQRLGVLGYGVRGQVGEISLGEAIPEKIRVLHPREFLPTHFWVEVLLDGHWCQLDASYDSKLAMAGLAVCEWDSDRTCFEVTRTFRQPEAMAYQMTWKDQAFVEAYFEAVQPFAFALNQWYQTIREGSGQADIPGTGAAAIVPSFLPAVAVDVLKSEGCKDETGIEVLEIQGHHRAPHE